MVVCIGRSSVLLDFCIRQLATVFGCLPLLLQFAEEILA